MIITIDGPTASGKSSVARSLAKKLAITYIASGLIYRALAYILITYYKYSAKTIAHPAVKVVTDIMLGGKFIYTYSALHGALIIYNDSDITSFLKTPEIDAASSIMSANPLVREIIIKFINNLSHNTDIIIEGRDCGSVIFPDADFKFFLTALLEVRAQRWVALQKKLGNTISFDDAAEFIAERDMRDSTRKIGPLIIPAGAQVIDNSSLSQEQIIEIMLAAIKK